VLEFGAVLLWGQAEHRMGVVEAVAHAVPLPGGERRRNLRERPVPSSSLTSSTDHLVYSHHQARHLELACDDGLAVWALARHGENWEGIWSESDPLLAALVKGFIRHDLFLQRIYHDFTDEIVGRYGPGLTGLFEWRRTADTADVDSEQPRRAQRPA
jgi:hypothetical protein